MSNTCLTKKDLMDIYGNKTIYISNTLFTSACIQAVYFSWDMDSPALPLYTNELIHSMQGLTKALFPRRASIEGLYSNFTNWLESTIRNDQSNLIDMFKTYNIDIGGFARCVTTFIIRFSIPIDFRFRNYESDIIAVDFDGCLFEDHYPDIGPPIRPVIDELLKRQKEGTKLILWTCRTGEKLNIAVTACRREGIVFDAVNENLPEIRELYDGDARKIFAHEYWDDKAVEKGVKHVSCHRRSYL